MSPIVLSVFFHRALVTRSRGTSRHAIERANDDTRVCLTIRGSQTANARILTRFLPHSVSAGALGALAAATIAVEAEKAVIHALAGQALTVRIFRAPVGSIATLIMYADTSHWYIYIYLYLSISISIYLSIHPSIHLSIYLSIYLYTYIYIYISYIYIYMYISG